MPPGTKKISNHKYIVFKYCVCLQHFSSNIDFKFSISRHLMEETHLSAR